MEYTNKVKQKIKNGEASLGGWCMTASPVSAEIMAGAGFDWVCIDAEHSPVNMETIQNIFMAVENKGAEPFVRISINGEKECKKVLDVGTKGVLVPMVKSYKDVEKAIANIKFSPVGNRSYALPRATDYGAQAKKYYEQANEMIFVGIMIEHIDAISELDKIFSNPQIDAVLVGPYDLSGSMGIPGEFNNNEFEDAIEEIYSKANEHNVNMGIHEVHPTAEKISNYIEDNYKFIACGIDTLFVKDSVGEIISKVIFKK